MRIFQEQRAGVPCPLALYLYGGKYDEKKGTPEAVGADAGQHAGSHQMAGHAAFYGKNLEALEHRGVKQ